jgi:hypothetical protein
LNETKEVFSPRSRKKGGIVSPQQRNKLRGVSFEGITREYRDKILVIAIFLMITNCIREEDMA